MKTTTQLFSPLMACLLSFPIVASAQGGTIDCARARGSVAALICSDDELAERDRALAAVFRAVSAKATGAMAKRLRAEQRGWVKGRNECWKAQQATTWITATWTENTVKGCVTAQYRLRTSELQAVWRLLPVTTARYGCEHNPANEVVVNSFATDPATIRLERGDRTVTLWQVSDSGEASFEGQNVSLRRTPQGVQVIWLDTLSGRTEDLHCTPQ